MGDSRRVCRPFHGLMALLPDQGYAFGSTLGYMLAPASRAFEKNFLNTFLEWACFSKQGYLPIRLRTVRSAPQRSLLITSGIF